MTPSELKSTRPLTGNKEQHRVHASVPLTGPEGAYKVQWVAQGLGRSIVELERVQSVGVTGDDAGRYFYIVAMEDFGLAIREDALSAFVVNCDVQKIGRDRLVDLLHQCNLQMLDLAEFRKPGRGGSDAWIQVATGEPPLPGMAERIEYQHPGTAHAMTAEKLDSISIEIESIWRADQPIREAIQNVHAPTAVPGEILARGFSVVPGIAGQDVFGRPIPIPLQVDEMCLEPGLFVDVTPENTYIARRYGYVYMVGGRLSIIPPIWLDEDAVRAFWMILDDRARPVRKEMMHQCLDDLNVVEGIQEDKIQSLVQEIEQGIHRCGLYRIAEGEIPQKGQDAQVEILVDLSRHSGQQREDGSLDFREVNFAPNVYAGQTVARYIAPSPGVSGRSVQGLIVPAQVGEDSPLCAGKNIRVEQVGVVRIFYAMLNGTLRVFGDELAVVEVLTIQGDVSFNTGNLSFGGAIYISGSVVQGFSVRAGGDITVAGTIEPGARVDSEKNVVVGQGIVGRKTKVRAKGDIRAQFVQEASLIAQRDIELGNYAYHVHLRAGRRVVVEQANGQNGGSIMGGQVWAGQRIETYIAGTRNGAPTMLNVGLGPEHAQEVERLHQHIETISAHIERILERFGLDHIDVPHIRNMIQASVPPRRKILAQLARELGKLTQVYQKQLEQRSQLEEHVGSELEGAEIRIWNRAYAGVLIRLGDNVRQLTEDVRAPHYRLQWGELIEA